MSGSAQLMDTSLPTSVMCMRITAKFLVIGYLRLHVSVHTVIGAGSGAGQVSPTVPCAVPLARTNEHRLSKQILIQKSLSPAHNSTKLPVGQCPSAQARDSSQAMPNTPGFPVSLPTAVH
ncbi:hypothetical protein E2C01_023227 [Portunus trituberculatus]|uniref:Uncharacterized protein n=1 Tax=Portunus trituberculatus TaxID=210409 RepID=A0A5B7EB05_PORTR|nr:hypothetical protein [Portunus trituberculatus]